MGSVKCDPKKMIESGNTGPALDCLLRKTTTRDQRNKISLLSYQWHSLENDLMMGFETAEKGLHEKLRINAALIVIIDGVKENLIRGNIKKILVVLIALLSSFAIGYLSHYILFPTVTPSFDSDLIQMEGVVCIQNSKIETGKIEYLGNVRIETSLGKSYLTDNSGRFTLTFPHDYLNKKIDIEASKEYFEVTNRCCLQNITIDPTRKIRVFMAKEGFSAEAGKKLFTPLHMASQDQHEYSLGSAFLSLPHTSKKDFEQYEQTRGSLERQLRFRQQEMKKFTDLLAQLNLDFAELEEKEAYQCALEGNIRCVEALIDNPIIDFQRQCLQ
jgi:hypothetical protein